MQINSEEANSSYQGAASPLGGSYTENKLHKLGLPDLFGKSFLDLGCNSGFYCNHAKQRGATRVVGVDIDKKVIASARRLHPDVEFLDEGWENFPSGTFDVVILLSAIHYASDPVAVVERIHKHLNPGGLLILEGGLVDSEGRWHTDCLIPGWRQVGDRCRHLSLGYVRNHLLRSFEWGVKGPSEPRGGDDVSRFVIHAKKTMYRSRVDHHTVDALEYASGLLLSAKTIVKAQPAYDYVTGLGRSDSFTPAFIDEIFANRLDFERFADDLAFALAPSQPLPVSLAPVLSPATLSALTAALKSRGIDVIAPPKRGRVGDPF